MEDDLRPHGLALYEILEVSLADTDRLIKYQLKGLLDGEFTLKGFGYSWVLSEHDWRAGQKVLDVGAGYSDLPKRIAERHGSEVWAVDDFGTQSGEPFWTRHKSPADFVQSQTMVKYVLERLGDPESSSLEPGSFDVVYSVSALEHVPDHEMRNVWRHMNRLLRVGGSMLHTIDLKFQADRGLKYLLAAEILDVLYPLLPTKTQIRYVRATPLCYLRSVSQILELKRPYGQSKLRPFRMVLDPEVLTDPPQITCNRVVKDDMKNIRHQRKTALALHLRKIS